MANFEDDMEKPVTKRELHEALGAWAGALEARFDAKLDALKGELGALKGEVGAIKGEVGAIKGEVGAIKGELGAIKGELGALKGEVGAIKGEVGAIKDEIRTLGKQLAAEFAQHANRILDTAREISGVVDEKYNDLPGRVTILEAKAFPPKRQRRR